MKKSTIAICVGLAFYVTSPVIVASDSLSGEEIRGLLNNKTFDGLDVQKGWASRIYANPNGEWTVKFKSGEKAGETLKMKWSVIGNDHCGHRYGQDFCGKLYPQGNGTYHKVRNNVHGFTISNIVDGNQMGE